MIWEDQNLTELAARLGESSGGAGKLPWSEALWFTSLPSFPPFFLPSSSGKLHGHWWWHKGAQEERVPAGNPEPAPAVEMAPRFHRTWGLHQEGPSGCKALSPHG